MVWSNWRKKFRGSSGISSASVVRRKGKGSIVLNNAGHDTVYYSGSDEQRYGVVFVVNKNIAHNVTGFRGLSEGMVELTVRLSKHYHLKFVQVYLPTTSYPDDEIMIYEEIKNIIINSKAHHNIVMGDFNAKLGPGEIREACTCSYGIGTRNRRGDKLVEFVERHKFKIMNTFFQKATEQTMEVDLSKWGDEERD